MSPNNSSMLQQKKMNHVFLYMSVRGHPWLKMWKYSKSKTDYPEWQEDFFSFAEDVEKELGLRPLGGYVVAPIDPAVPLRPGNIQWLHMNNIKNFDKERT